MVFFPFSHLIFFFRKHSIQNIKKKIKVNISENIFNSKIPLKTSDMSNWMFIKIFPNWKIPFKISNI